VGAWPLRAPRADAVYLTRGLQWVLLEHLTSALVAYGIWGILLLAFVDSAGIPVAIGMDALVLLIAAKDPARGYLGAAMAVLGSIAGNLALFLAAKKGGQLARKPPQVQDPRRFRKWFRRYGLSTVFIPALVPVIPLPLKVFVISAGVLGVRLRSFLLVVLAARIMRYFGEAWLGIRLGRESSRYLHENVWGICVAAIVLTAAIFLLVRLNELRLRRLEPGGNGGMQR
jgi:undecaprenyl-diphosphatase